MVVKRVSDLDIHRRTFITAIGGYVDDAFIDEDLCAYTFEQQLYLYLKKEGYNRILFYNRASGFNLYAYDRESLDSLYSQNPPTKTANPPLGKVNLLGKSAKNETNSDSPSKGHIKSKYYNGRKYFYISDFKDSTLVTTVQEVISNSTYKSVIYFTTTSFDLGERQTFVDNISHAYNEVAASGSQNKILIRYNTSGVFKSEFFVNILKSSENVFNVGLPDRNEYRNWLNAQRIKGNICSDFIFRFSIETIIDLIYRKRQKINNLNIDLGIKREHFIDDLHVVPKSDEEILSELNNMIGLRRVKEAVAGIIADVKAKKIRAKYGQTCESKINLNFVFKGNPGTGKTTVAQILGNILANYELINSPEVVKYTKRDLIDGLVGGGARNVEKMFEDSVGKMLFIDEAYQLADDDAKDAKDALTNMLTDPRFKDKIAIILAGYPGDMAQLISSNPGLKSRFTQDIFFEDYSNDELTEIFRRMLVKENFVLTDDALIYAHTYFSTLKRNEDFGNGRVAEKLRDSVKKRLGVRLLTIANPTKEDAFTIFSQDFPNYGKINPDKFRHRHKANIAPIDRLNELIGIDGIRRQFETYIHMAHYCQENPQTRISATFRPHMAFLGNPGTGKSTVARLFGEILQQEGLLANSNFVEVGPSDLIGQYLGTSGPKARSQFERARGGVLFIDEAYQLCREDQLNGGDQYGKEVITELIKFMEDDRDTVVILAGYTDEIRYLIQHGNPGLASRVTNEFIFEDYTPDTLLDILMQKLGEYEMSEEFKLEMHQILEHVYNNKGVTKFDNARAIENYANDIFKIFLEKHKAKGIIDCDCIPPNIRINK